MGVWKGMLAAYWIPTRMHALRLGLLLSVYSAISMTIGHAAPKHGLAMRGEVALSPDFKHLPYANPNAPKGGKLVYGVFGTFDSLNPFIVKSMRTGARGMWDTIFGNLVYETLMFRSRDEPFSLYGLLAEKAEMAPDRSWIEFHLNPNARFSDGEPVKVSDALFTFKLLRDKGRPPYSTRIKQTKSIEQTGPRSFKITFNEKASRETPLLFALMPVLAEHATDVGTFDQSTLKPPVSSGPYLVDSLSPGQFITYKRDPNYWGKDLPINRGLWNFDEIKVEYFTDPNTQFEAFKKGLFDIYPENSISRWRTGYDIAAVKEGKIARGEFATKLPSGMLGFVFNTRRDKFKNRNVRKALAMLFDFEWANENLFFGAYQRTTSYWQNSALSSFGVPASEAEKVLLSPFPNAVDQEVMSGTYRSPVSDGTGRDRKLLRAALSEFRKEGFKLKDGKLLRPNGEPLELEILMAGDAGISSQDIQRLALSYQKTAAKLGITVNLRGVDDAQYQARKGSFDYDLVIARYSSSLSPGAEQIFRWGSQSRDAQGSFNFAGTSEPVLDALIEAMLNAQDEDNYTAAVRAFDRVLVSGHYVIPLYHLPKRRIAYWKSKLARPEAIPLYGPRFPTWWHREAK